MTDTIKAAKSSRQYFLALADMADGQMDGITSMQAKLQAVIKESYIDGLQTAVRLLEQEPARELQ